MNAAHATTRPTDSALALIAQAETALARVRQGEDRPREALSAARAYLDGAATEQAVRRAASDSHTSASRATTCSDARACHAAAYAAEAVLGDRGAEHCCLIDLRHLGIEVRP